MFQPLTATTISGTFGTQNLNLGNGESFLPTYTATALNLEAVPTGTTVYRVDFGTGNWTTTSDWSTEGALPGSSDVSLHPSTGNVTFNSGTSHHRRPEHRRAAFTLSGGTLTVNGNLQAGSTFTLAGGTLSNATVVSGLDPDRSGHCALTGITLAGLLELASNITPTNVTVTVNQGLTLNNGTVERFGYFVPGGSLYPATLQLAGSGTQTLGGTGQVIFSSPQSTTHLVNILDSTAGQLVVGSGVSVSLNGGQYSELQQQ